MEKVISCCGVVCSDCESYPNECKGCAKIQGNVFWLQYVEADICPIYRCCVNEKQYEHCGKCPLLPCEFYLNGDPTKTQEENQAILERQLAQLRSM